MGTDRDEQVKVQLSSLMDGELEHEALALLSKRIAADESLSERWRDYHLISDTLKQHLPEQGVVDLSAKISQAIENEPSLVEVKRRPISHMAKQVSGMAVAASVAIFGVVAVVNMGVQQGDSEIPQLAATDSTPHVQVASIASQPEAPKVVDPRLNKYLVDHSEYAVSASVHGVLPYARIVSQQQVQK